jgi:hypothetical protein
MKVPFEKLWLVGEAPMTEAVRLRSSTADFLVAREVQYFGDSFESRFSRGMGGQPWRLNGLRLPKDRA